MRSIWGIKAIAFMAVPSVFLLSLTFTFEDPGNPQSQGLLRQEPVMRGPRIDDMNPSRNIPDMK